MLLFFAMQDLAAITATVGFFAVAIGYVLACLKV